MNVSGLVRIANCTVSPEFIVWQTGTNLGSYDTGGGPPVPVSYTVVAVGPTTVTYALTSGALPPSLSLDGATGVISGNGSATAPSTVYTFDITAYSGAQSLAKTFTITALNSAGGNIGN